MSWLFSEEDFVKELPSRKQNMPVSYELRQRELIHEFLIRLGLRLKLDGRTILAATVYANRYYMRLPITPSKYYVALAALAVSCKLHDNYRQPDKIALQAAALKSSPGNPPIDEHNDIFWKWRDQLLYREELLLKTLNFELKVPLPYDIMDTLMESDDDETPAIEILKSTNTFVEILLSLPIFVAFDTYTIYGTSLIIVCHESGKTILGDWLKRRLRVDAEMCWECYRYILRLIEFATSDPKMPLNKIVVKRVPKLEEAVFLA